MTNTIFLLVLTPLALIPMISSYLLGFRVSICQSLLLTTLVPFLVEGDSALVFFHSILIMLMGVSLFHDVCKRSVLIVRMFYLFLILLILSFWWVFQHDLTWAKQDGIDFTERVISSSFWRTWNLSKIAHVWSAIPQFWRAILMLSAVNCVFSMVAMFILPLIFQRYFDVVSPITLKDLSSMDDHPLLEEMKSKAPGTHKHCEDIGRMAEDAAACIGANKLLAKVSGCFHDIGKIADPLCFIENNSGNSIHDSLPPEESARRIREHVTNGWELARKYHLPRPICQIILCHHGNDIVRFFYDKACRLADEHGEPRPDESLFRYDAPLPHSKEAVIVGIADICEAAARSKFRKAPEVNHKIIREFVFSLVTEKLKSCQFGGTDMTLAELTAVCDSMTKSLEVIYHERIEYPQAMPDLTSALSQSFIDTQSPVSETQDIIIESIPPANEEPSITVNQSDSHQVITPEQTTPVNPTEQP